MPLSKARNRERMKKTRLHVLLSPPKKIKPVQPREGLCPSFKPELDADGNMIPDYEN